MLNNSQKAYDVIIIGAGISGLICGCYLAKAGMKVLIAEQHTKPGGYCTSFKRNGFSFDAAAHSFGSYRQGGTMHNIFQEFKLSDLLKINRFEPSDTIISPDYKISFWSDVNRTIQEFQLSFPHEANGISAFFRFLTNSKPVDLAALRNKTYDNLLAQYFADEKLKSILSIPILGVGGLPASSISAFSAAALLTEFFLDGGYYPEGGMQALPDALAYRFKEYGGELQLSCLVKKIKTRCNKIEGVVLNKKEFIPATHVVACCDAMQVFFKLIDREATNNLFLQKLKQMTPSISMFIAYIRIDEQLQNIFLPGVTLWFIPHYKIENLLNSSMKNKDINSSTPFLIHVPPDRKSLEVLVMAPFKSKGYWADKRGLLDKLIMRIEAVYPKFSEHIVYKNAATPHTLYRYTLNYNGAAYGWASTPQQLYTKGLTQISTIKNMYLSGHWTTQAQGISGVAYLGQQTAKIIIKKNETN